MLMPMPFQLIQDSFGPEYGSKEFIISINAIIKTVATHGTQNRKTVTDFKKTGPPRGFDFSYLSVILKLQSSVQTPAAMTTINMKIKTNILIANTHLLPNVS